MSVLLFQRGAVRQATDKLDRIGDGKRGGHDLNKTVARVVQHPEHADVIDLVNLDDVPWLAVLPDGTEFVVKPNTQVRLHPGVRIDFHRVKGIVE
jgi:hypothetical protein